MEVPLLGCLLYFIFAPSETFHGNGQEQSAAIDTALELQEVLPLHSDLLDHVMEVVPLGLSRSARFVEKLTQPCEIVTCDCGWGDKQLIESNESGEKADIPLLR